METTMGLLVVALITIYNLFFFLFLKMVLKDKERTCDLLMNMKRKEEGEEVECCEPEEEAPQPIAVRRRRRAKRRKTEEKATEATQE